MDDQLFNIFLQQNYSMHQIHARFNILKNYLATKMFNSKNTSYELSSEDLDWIKSLGKDFLNAFTPLNTNQMLDNLEKKIRTIKPLTIYIPLELPDKEQTKLGIWLRKSFSPTFVFETKFDGNLIGGAAFSWNGIYHDFSIRSKIEKDKDAIVASMKKLLK